MWKKKVYFYATEFFDKTSGRKSLVFCWQNGQWGHRAGWGPDKVNFVLNKLVQKRGTKRWIQIYQAFNDALLEVSKDKVEGRNFPKWVLVMFSKENENWVWQGELDSSKTSETIYERESRLQKVREGKEETTSTTEV